MGRYRNRKQLRKYELTYMTESKIVLIQKGNYHIIKKLKILILKYFKYTFDFI